MTDFDEDPPVVARLVVEIRSDGTRTVARGAIEDRTVGQTTAVQIEAGTPGGAGAPAHAGRCFGWGGSVRAASRGGGSCGGSTPFGRIPTDG